MKMPDFMKDATNVYRTEQFIVRQIIVLEDDLVEGTNLCSYDTYFYRNALRDAEYEAMFKARRFIDGKRLRTGSVTSKYVR